MQLNNIVLIVAGTLTGLDAGLLYAFSVAVVPSLRALKGTQHIAAMQTINVKILNSVFFLGFFGPTILLPVAAFLYWGTPQFGWLLAAALLHILGANGVTAMGNIPLNNQLAEIDIDQISEEEADKVRKEFQGPGSPWMLLHTIRTLAAIAATVLVFVACLLG
ncbi:DUF1772 domain-containing protein [Ktedonospora formicarum]|uniref:DUF1772 domain-containing protein n=1 Tax=Ktedonospora formicarum TaxID=2778364 RepID=A0A8J3MY49_9CHLR|nr:anthrone oxygenase family protein [Ktedonospora formicarum]GHO49280.1 hypothetical protein KSX_74430 [Ktedonospora formicarum]